MGKARKLAVSPQARERKRRTIITIDVQNSISAIGLRGVSTPLPAMDYKKIDPDHLSDAPSPTKHKKEIDEAVGATTFGCNLYEAKPGEQISMGRHYHPEHEELMYVLDGLLRFETPKGDFEVEAGEAFFVPMGAVQKGYAAGGENVRFLAIGAPKSEDHAVICESCGSCGETTDREFAMEGDDEHVIVLYCSDCGIECERFSAGPS